MWIKYKDKFKRDLINIVIDEYIYFNTCNNYKFRRFSFKNFKNNKFTLHYLICG